MTNKQFVKKILIRLKTFLGGKDQKKTRDEVLLLPVKDKVHIRPKLISSGKDIFGIYRLRTSYYKKKGNILYLKKVLQLKYNSYLYRKSYQNFINSVKYLSKTEVPSKEFELFLEEYRKRPQLIGSSKSPVKVYKLRTGYYKKKGNILYSKKALRLKYKYYLFIEKLYKKQKKIRYNINLAITVIAVLSLYICLFVCFLTLISYVWRHKLKTLIIIVIASQILEDQEDWDTTNYLEDEGTFDEVEDEDESVNEPSPGGTAADSWQSIVFQCDLITTYKYEFLSQAGKKMTRYQEDCDWFLLNEIHIDLLDNIEWRLEDQMEVFTEDWETPLEDDEGMAKHLAEEEMMEWQSYIKKKKDRDLEFIQFIAPLIEDEEEDEDEEDDGEEPPDFDEFASRLYGIGGIAFEADFHHLDARNWPEHSLEDNIEWNPERRWTLQIQKKTFSPMFNERYFVCYYKRNKLFYLLEEYTEALLEEEVIMYFNLFEEETAPRMIQFIRFLVRPFSSENLKFPIEDIVEETDTVLPYELKYPLCDIDPVRQICPEDLLLDEFISSMLMPREMKMLKKKKVRNPLADDEVEFLKNWIELYFPWLYGNDTKGDPVTMPSHILKSLWVPSSHYRANRIIEHLWTILSMDEDSRITFIDMDDDSYPNLKSEVLFKPLELLDLNVWEDEFWPNLVSFTPIIEKKASIGFFDSPNGRGYFLKKQENIDYDAFAEYHDPLFVYFQIEDNHDIQLPVGLIEGRKGIYFFTGAKDLNLEVGNGNKNQKNDRPHEKRLYHCY